MIEKLIKKGYRVVISGLHHDTDQAGRPVDISLDDRKVVIIAEYGYAAIDARGRYFEGGSHPPQVFRALELARWREERQKAGPLPIKADTIE